MKCIIVEDQPPAQRILKKYVADIGTLELAGVFSDGLQALEYINAQPVDLIFLDIHLPKLSGIDFLKSLGHPPAVILTTAFSEYALEGYEFDVVDYLLKPFSFQRFVQAVSKVTRFRSEREGSGPLQGSTASKEIFIKSGYEHIRVNMDDIHYIKSDADYTEIVTDSKKHLSPEPLRYWEEHLPGNEFIRVHKSFIVHLQKIEKLTSSYVYIQHQKAPVPIGRAYKEGFLKRVLE